MDIVNKEPALVFVLSKYGQLDFSNDLSVEGMSFFAIELQCFLSISWDGALIYRALVKRDYYEYNQSHDKSRVECLASLL